MKPPADTRPPWSPMPDAEAMKSMAKSSHHYLFNTNAGPRVLIWRKVLKRDGTGDRLDKHWTTIDQLPPAAKAEFEKTLADWSALAGK